MLTEDKGGDGVDVNITKVNRQRNLQPQYTYEEGGRRDLKSSRGRETVESKGCLHS